MKKIVVLSTALALSAFPVSASDFPETIEVFNWGEQMITHWVPPETAYPESAEDAAARYKGILKDVISVVYDPEELPLYRGEYGRAKTYALVLSTMRDESSFRRDVDFGLLPKGRGDGGRSWCLMQIRLSKEQKDGSTKIRIGPRGPYYQYFADGSGGFDGPDLVEDRKACIRVGLHMMRESLKVCQRNIVSDRLALYAGTSCKDEKGQEKSRRRFQRAVNWTHQYKPPVDEQVMIGLHGPEYNQMALGG